MKSIILGIDIAKEKFDVTLINGDKKKTKVIKTTGRDLKISCNGLRSRKAMK